MWRGTGTGPAACTSTEAEEQTADSSACLLVLQQAGRPSNQFTVLEPADYDMCQAKLLKGRGFHQQQLGVVVRLRSCGAHAAAVPPWIQLLFCAIQWPRTLGLGSQISHPAA